MEVILAERAFNTLEEAEIYLMATTRAQSFILAAALRPLIQNGFLSEDDLASSLAETERAALQRRTLETPAISGLAQMLRQDLGLPEGTGHGD